MASFIAMSRIRVAENVRSIPGADKIEDLGEAPLEEFPLDFQAEVKALAKSIADVGLINPLTVKDLGKGESFRLVAGFRRYKALQYLGRKQVDVKSVKGKSSEEKVLQLVENVHREDLNPLDIAKALEEIRSIRGITKQAMLAEVVGKSSGWVSQHLALLKADDAIREAVESGEMGLAAARTLTSLPREDQKSAVEDAKKEAQGNGKKKVSTKGARRQARKKKSERDGKQMKIRPVAEREAEQKVALVKEYLSERYGDLQVPHDVHVAVEGFWDFLFKKDRVYIAP